MEITVQRIPDSPYRFIPVPSEQIKGDGKVDRICFEDRNFDVFDRITYKKGEHVPEGFLTAVTGKQVNSAELWSFYPNSDAIVVFIVREIIDNLPPKLE